jgi:predicted DNA-binding protein
MKRTNIYLDEEQLESLRGLSDRRGQPVAALVREAVDEWLRGQGVRLLPEDERVRRFEALLRRRDKIWRELDVSEDEVERDVTEAIREVRRARAARRH